MNWDNGWHHGDLATGWWLLMAIMMLAFWGGLALLVVTLIRSGRTAQHGAPASVAPGPQAERPDPEQILHERFARGEIDIEEYDQRIDALRAKRPPPS